MGVMKDSSGNSIAVGSSVFTAETLLEENNKKYYDLYDYQKESDDSAASFKRYHIGDATKEVLANFGGYSWNGDSSWTICSTAPWVIRGGVYNYGSGAGLFNFHRTTGGAISYDSFRSVLTAQ